MEWTQGLAELFPCEVAAIDGKTVRRSQDKRAGRPAIWSEPGPRRTL